MKLKELRDRRDAKATELQKFHDSTVDKKWTPEFQSTYDELMGEIVDLDNSIRRTEDLARIAAEGLEPTPGNLPTLTDEKREQLEKDKKAVAFNKFLRRGWEGFTNEEIIELRNTMSTTTDAEGGYTVASEVASRVVEAMKAFGGMREVATIQPTSKGNPLSWPTTDGTAEEGEIIAENASATDLDIAFGTLAIGAYKYSSKVVTVPFELMQDSEIDVEALVRGRIDSRLARIENKHFTVGTGSGQPRGVVTASTAGKVGASGQTITVLYDDLVDLIHSVDPVYRSAGRFMLHDTMLQTLRKLKDGDGRPHFWASTDNLAEALPMSLMGYPIKINQDMPTPAANAKSILFGDFSKYLIRDVMSVTLFRFTDSVYTKKGQVGFLAWMRADGNFIDVGPSMKHYAHAAS